MKYKLSNRSLRNLDGVNLELVEVVKMAIQLTKVDFGIPETGGYRTEKMQFELYERGLSQLDGYTAKSMHQTGRAVDFYAYVDGKASYEIEHMAQVACAFLEAGHRLGVELRWGGLFKSFIDMPHIEMVKR